MKSNETVLTKMGWLYTYGILILIYFLVLTPLGLILRLLKKDGLLRTIDPQAQSYWTKRTQSRATKRSLEKQY